MNIPRPWRHTMLLTNSMNSTTPSRVEISSLLIVTAALVATALVYLIQISAVQSSQTSHTPHFCKSSLYQLLTDLSHQTTHAPSPAIKQSKITNHQQNASSKPQPQNNSTCSLSTVQLRTQKLSKLERDELPLPRMKRSLQVPKVELPLLPH